MLLSLTPVPLTEPATYRIPVGKVSVIVIPVTLELLIFSTVTLAVSVSPQMVMFLGAVPTIFNLLP
jgi:hypothetical protein